MPAGDLYAASEIIGASSTGSPNLTDISPDGRPGPTLAAAVIGTVSLCRCTAAGSKASNVNLPLANVTQRLVLGPADSAFQSSVVQPTGR